MREKRSVQNYQPVMLWICSIVIATSFCISIVPSIALGAEPPITGVAFSPGGKSVLATSQVGVKVYSWPGLSLRKTLLTEAKNVHCLAFSPSGKHLAVGGGAPSESGVAEVFSWPAGDSRFKLLDHKDSVLDLAWNGETQLVTAGVDRQVRVWDIGKRSVLHTFSRHSRSVSSLCLLDAKTLISAGADQSIRVWDLESRKISRNLNQHTAEVHSLSQRASTSGLPMVASAAGDRTVRFWQPTIGRMVRYVRLSSEPLDVAWLPNTNRLTAACTDGRIYVIDTDEVEVVEAVDAVEGWAYAVAAHPTDGSIVVGGSKGQIKRVTPRSP